MAGILDQRFHKLHVTIAAKNRVTTVQSKMNSIHIAAFMLGGTFDNPDAMRVDQEAIKVTMSPLLTAILIDTFSYQTVPSRIAM